MVLKKLQTVDSMWLVVTDDSSLHPMVKCPNLSDQTRSKLMWSVLFGASWYLYRT